MAVKDLIFRGIGNSNVAYILTRGLGIYGIIGSTLSARIAVLSLDVNDEDRPLTESTTSGISSATDFYIDGGITQLKNYTVLEVPSAADNTGMIIYVSDEAGGAIPAFSDGTNWRRVTDRAIIS
jgi:hypothetical protein